MNLTLGLRTLLLLALVAGATCVLLRPGMPIGEPLLRSGVSVAHG